MAASNQFVLNPYLAWQKEQGIPIHTGYFVEDLRTVHKKLVLNLDDLGIPLDNVEGLTFGPRLRDGRQTVVLVSDNNFAASQFTQFLLFALDR